jgi:hypothetical protein
MHGFHGDSVSEEADDRRVCDCKDQSRVSTGFNAGFNAGFLADFLADFLAEYASG